MTVIRFLFPAVLGYLLGSVNLSLIITKYVGKFDITKRGSGNAGGTNVVRTMGFKWGAITILLEIIKSLAAGVISKYIFPCVFFGTLGELEPTIVGMYSMVFCLLGNVLPVFCKFKGGKGVSTSAAVVIFLDWRVAIICFGLFALVLFISHTVSLGSLLGSITAPFTTLLFYHSYEYCWLLVLLVSVFVAMIYIRHISNIKRLITGTENKFNFGKKK